MTLGNLRTCLEQTTTKRVHIPVDEKNLRGVLADDLKAMINRVFENSDIQPILHSYRRKKMREENPRPERLSYEHDYFRVSSAMDSCMTITDGDLLVQKGSLAHCVSSDFQMSKGIAFQITKRYPKMRLALPQEVRPDLIGRCVSYKIGPEPKFVFNLVTKEKAADKPTYESLLSSLVDLKLQLKKEKIDKIFMPTIGCGLDGLNWEYVGDIIERAFAKSGIRVIVVARD
jgi:O-acetyl-ADP-ribose deacetylase (regulator of RNase III)